MSWSNVVATVVQGVTPANLNRFQGSSLVGFGATPQGLQGVQGVTPETFAWRVA